MALLSFFYAKPKDVGLVTLVKPNTTDRHNGPEK